MNKMNTRKMSFSRVKTLIYYSRSCFLDISVDLFFFSRGLLYEPVGMSVQTYKVQTGTLPLALQSARMSSAGR